MHLICVLTKCDDVVILNIDKPKFIKAVVALQVLKGFLFYIIAKSCHLATIFR